jgi:hypothetical protein
MDFTPWVSRCSDRLLELWPDLSGSDTDDIACDMWKLELWHAMPPEEAALAWSVEYRHE